VADDATIDGEQLSTKIDTTVPHSARIWNYWLGGKDNYAVDRAAGDQFLKVFPAIADIARESRLFLGRAVSYLAAEEGIRQFLDVGTGLPTADNTHQVAQRIAPQSQVVYVDNDPSVLAYARALLTSAPEGTTDYVDADVREPAKILETAAKTLDFSRPVALILTGTMGHITDDGEARSIVRQLLEPLPSGSFLVLCDGTNVVSPGPGEQAQQDYNESGAMPYGLRSPEQLAGFFEGLELMEPGLVSCPRWRPDDTDSGVPGEVDVFGGVARKP
jgi:S-adenosyl methyltransferase